MFINQEPHEIDDFLKAVNFIAPKGMSLQYFIVPYAAGAVASAPNGLSSLAKNNNFVQEVNPNKVKGITDTIVYKKRDLHDRQSFNDANFNINQIPNEFPITRPAQAQISSNLEPMQADLIAAGADIQSPIKGVQVVESTLKTRDFIINEAIGPFPKNTLFHFEKDVLNEASRVDPDLHVGNTKFYKVPKSQNSDFRYTYERPEGTTYSRVLAYIVNHPGCSRNDIIEGVRPELKGYDNKGQYSGLFQSLHHDGWFRVTTKGEYFPCKKACDFVRKLGLKESIQFGKGSNPPTEKDEEIAEKFCILMDWAVTPEDIWQVYDYGNGKATISVTKDMDAAMTDQECSDLDDVYYYDYENDCIISKESEELAKGTFDESKKVKNIRMKESAIICARCGGEISPEELTYEDTLLGKTPFHKECAEADIEFDDDWGIDYTEDDFADEIDDYYDMSDDEDLADRDMGEMYGNYSGDVSFFESKKMKESFTRVEVYTDEVVKDFMGQYSKSEAEKMSDIELYDKLTDYSCRYIDGDGETFDDEVNHLAGCAFRKIRNGPFNESTWAEEKYDSSRKDKLDKIMDYVRNEGYAATTEQDNVIVDVGCDSEDEAEELSGNISSEFGTSNEIVTNGDYYGVENCDDEYVNDYIIIVQ